MKTKYKIFSILVFVLSSFLFLDDVQANYSAVVVNSPNASCDIYSRTHPNSSNRGFCLYKDSKLDSIVSGAFFLDTGDSVTVLEDKGTVKTNNEELCRDNYVYVSHTTSKGNTYEGLYCSTYLKPIATTDEIKKELEDAGFPESYWDGLTKLKMVYPNWTFRAVKTNVDWNKAVEAESAVGMSLIDGSEEGYRSTLGGSYDYETDIFKVMEGSRWYAANSDVVGYYMDPRNFLNITDIFQFSTLESNPLLNTLEGVNAVLGNNFLSKDASSFVSAADTSGVNSVYLAALAIQEVGNGTVATNGNGFTYDTRNKKYASLRGKWIEGGYFNVYNIGAGTDVSPAQNSVIYAMGGENFTETSYGRPWDSIGKAIIGGAEFIGTNYVKKGQYTIYSKKFNVHPTEWGLFSHQYQTNIRGASSEGTKIYNAYYKLGILNQAFEFAIPVYENMPNETKMPNPGNPNNYLKSLKVNDTLVNAFKGDTIDYTVYVNYGVKVASIEAIPVNSKSNVDITGNTDLVVGENKFTILVTAQNGSSKTYNLNIVRSDNETGEPTVDEIVDELWVKSDGTYFSGISLDTKTSVLIDKVKSLNANASVTINGIDNIDVDSKLKTGDIVAITSAKETKSFTVVIYGDTNGDGIINALDLLRIQKHILNVSNLTNASFKAADVSKDGSINALDLLKVQKHILGAGYIEQ